MNGEDDVFVPMSKRVIERAADSMARPTDPVDGQCFKDIASGRNIVFDAACKMWRDAASGAPA